VITMPVGPLALSERPRLVHGKRSSAVFSCLFRCFAFRLFGPYYFDFLLFTGPGRFLFSSHDHNIKKKKAGRERPASIPVFFAVNLFCQAR
jgi:hypothetical protein